MPAATALTNTHSHTDSSGGRLVSLDGRVLPLKGAHLRAEAKGGIARVVLAQTFVNPYQEPLQVTYQLPLPADGAVSGYAFKLGDRRIVGEVDRKQQARERFEQAILDGRTAGLVDQERSSLFTQELGNVPPGAEIVAELTVDQKLAWLPEGAWEWRFPTVIAPRYLGGAGHVPDADKVTVDVADRPTGISLSMGLVIRDRLDDHARPESPSHTVRSSHGADAWEVALIDEGATLDRDVVVRWIAAAAAPGVAICVARPASGKPHATSAYGLITVIPPQPKYEPEPLPRDLIVLLDTSGSMGGEPLDQARRVVAALVDSMTDRDRLEMIEFSNSPRRWKSGAVEMSGRARKDALAWLASLRASGGTEMRTGLLEALHPLRDGAQRQVVLLTDGLIGSEQEILQAVIERLPPSCRLHAVGIGSAVNRSLSQPAARAGRGVELIIGLGEDAERAARRLVARTCAPLITELSVHGSALEGTAPQRIPDLFAGAPALISARLKAEGGELVLRGKTANGAYSETIRVGPVEPGEGSAAVCALYAREAVEDLELAIAGGANRKELDAQLEKIGVSFQISTRLTSWIAVSAEVTVDPTAPTRRENVPQMLPHGMSAQGLGLRPAIHAINAPMAPPPPMAAAPRMGAAGVFKQRAPAGRPSRQRAEPELSKAKKELARDDEEGTAASGGAAPFAEEADTFDAAFPPMDEPAQPEEKAAKKPAPAQEQERAKDAAANTTRAGQAPWVLSGKVLRRTDHELVIEISLPQGGAWPQLLSALISLADGGMISAEIDPKRTTLPVQARPGVNVRVALTFRTGALGSRELTSVRLGNDGPVILVNL